MAWIRDAKTAADGSEIVIDAFDNVHAPEGDYKFDKEQDSLVAPDGETVREGTYHEKEIRCFCFGTLLFAWRLWWRQTGKTD